MLVYYKKADGQFRSYCHDTKTYETVDELPYETNKFEMMPSNKPKDERKPHQKLEASDEGLKTYAEKLIADRKQILDTGITKYDIFKETVGKNGVTYYKTSNNITTDFFKVCTPFMKRVECDNIEYEEVDLMEKAFGSHIIYAEEGEYNNIYGYDFVMFYPRLMASKQFKMPRTAGYWIDFNEASYKDIKQIQYGYYNCRITSTNDTFNKVFMQKYVKGKPTNYFTHFDLICALKVQKFLPPGQITIEPLGYAYVYDELLDGDYVFGSWYEIVTKIKKACPGNIVIKKLTSSLWGHLCASNSIHVQEDEAMENYDMVRIIPEDPEERKGKYYIKAHKTNDLNESTSYYTLVDLEKSFQKQNYRLKSFLPSYGRSMMIECLFSELFVNNTVRRIICDGFLLEGKFPKLAKYPSLKLEHENRDCVITSTVGYKLLR